MTLDFYPMPLRPGATQEEMLALAARRIDRCLLCMEAPEYLGCFVATRDPEKFLPVKIRPGKTRTLWYGLCGACYALPDKAQRVEDYFERKAIESRN
jgi:hypothetical protein